MRKAVVGQTTAFLEYLIPMLPRTREPMIHQNSALCRLLIPEGVEFSHPDEARLYAEILRRTSTQKEFRRASNPEFVPFSKNLIDRMFTGTNRALIRKLARDNEYLQWNESYSDGYITARGDYLAPFTKSVRLNPRFRSGRFQTVTIPKRREHHTPKKHYELGPVCRALASRLCKIWLPENAAIQPEKPWHHLLAHSARNAEKHAAVCSFGHRFHSNYTSLPGYLRRQLQSDLPLTRVDISCAQPLFLGALALKTFGPRHDLLDWIALCQYGMVYQQMAGELGWTLKDTKIRCVIGLFSQTTDTLANRTFQWIRKHHPSIAEFVLGTKTKNYTTTARVLQRAESLIVVHRVAKEFMQKFPGLPIITIHDELIIPTDTVEWVSKALHRACRPLGISPSLKISHNETV